MTGDIVVDENDDIRLVSRNEPERDFETERTIAKTLEHLRQHFEDKVPDKEYWQVGIGLAFAILKCAFYGGNKQRKVLNDLISLLRYFEQSILPRPPIASYQISKLVEQLDSKAELLKDEEFSLHEFTELVLRTAQLLFPELFTKDKIKFKELTEEVMDYINDPSNADKVLEILTCCKHYIYRR